MKLPFSRCGELPGCGVLVELLEAEVRPVERKTEAIEASGLARPDGPDGV